MKRKWQSEETEFRGVKRAKKIEIFIKREREREVADLRETNYVKDCIKFATMFKIPQGIPYISFNLSTVYAEQNARFFRNFPALKANQIIQLDPALRKTMPWPAGR